MENYVKIIQDVKDDTMINQKFVKETIPPCKHRFMAFDNRMYTLYKIDRQYSHLYTKRGVKYNKPQKIQYASHNKIVKDLLNVLK